MITRADPEDPRSVHALQSYYAELAARFEGGFDVTRSCDPEASLMRPPKGAFFLAEDGPHLLGCVGLKGGADYGEVKRLWVSAEARGRGVARALMGALEDEARALGVTLLRLDTNSALPEAAALYRATGWSEIPRFNPDPYPDLFFEKRL